MYYFLFFKRRKGNEKQRVEINERALGKKAGKTILLPAFEAMGKGCCHARFSVPFS